MMTEDQLKAAEDMNKSINTIFEELGNYIDSLREKERNYPESRFGIDNNDFKESIFRLSNLDAAREEYQIFNNAYDSWSEQGEAENYMFHFNRELSRFISEFEDSERAESGYNKRNSSELSDRLYNFKKKWNLVHGVVDYRYNDVLRKEKIGGKEFNASLGENFDHKKAMFKEAWWNIPIYLDPHRLDSRSTDFVREYVDSNVIKFIDENVSEKDKSSLKKYTNFVSFIADSIDNGTYSDDSKNYIYNLYTLSEIDVYSEVLDDAWKNVEKNARIKFLNGEEYKNVCKEDFEQYKKVQYMMPVWLTEKSLSGDLTQIGLAKEVIGEVRSFADEKLKNPLDRKPFIDYANFIDKTIEGIESGKYNSEDVRKRVGCWESYSDCLKENLNKLQNADGKDKLEIAEKETVKDLLSYYPAEFVKDVYENFTVSNVGIDKNKFDESFDRLVREKFERNISKDDIRSRISDIKNCGIEFYSPESVDNCKNFYRASMLYELKHGSDIKTAEKHTTCKMIDCMFKIEDIKDTLRQCSPLANTYPIGVVVDSISDKRNKVIDYRNYNVEHCKKELGLNASCRDTYLKERNAAMSNGVDYYKADDVALGKMVGRFPIDEIKKTFRENSPLFVGDPHGCSAYVNRKIPDIKLDKERVVAENKLNVQAKEAQQLKKMAERADKPLQHNRKDFQWE